MIGIALVLWCWKLFLIFKETPSWILLKKRFAATKAQKIIILYKY
jgi:hypothetical protein